MNKRQWAGVIVACAGIAASAYAIHAMNEIKAVKKETNFLTRPTGKNPIGKMANSKIESKVSEYTMQARFLLIGGIALILIGGGAVYYLRK